MTDLPEMADAGEEQAVIDQGDAPISSLVEDRLGRRPFSQALAAEILAAPADRGYVMGLTGPWGSGKTSILNMTIDALSDEAIVVQFNPWMFSGTEALVGSFFTEIGKQLTSGIASSRASPTSSPPTATCCPRLPHLSVLEQQ